MYRQWDRRTHSNKLFKFSKIIGGKSLVKHTTYTLSKKKKENTDNINIKKIPVNITLICLL